MPLRMEEGVSVVMARKGTAPRYATGIRPANQVRSAQYRGAPGRRWSSGLLGCHATPDPTQTRPVPVPVRLPGRAARALAGAARGGPRSRRVDRDGRPTAIAVGLDRRPDRRGARTRAAAPGLAYAPERWGGTS